MKSLNKLIRLADKFEYKLIKYASYSNITSDDMQIIFDSKELPSDYVTFFARPTINEILGSTSTKTLINSTIKKLQSLKITGYLKWGGNSSITNAKKINNKWRAGPCKLRFELSGDAADNDIARRTIDTLFNAISNQYNARLQRYLDNNAEKWANQEDTKGATQITHYPVTTNSGNLSF